MAVRPIIRCVIIDLYKESDVTFFENRLETGKTAKTRFSLVSLVQGCTTHHSMGNRELMYCKSRHFFGIAAKNRNKSGNTGYH